MKNIHAKSNEAIKRYIDKQPAYNYYKEQLDRINITDAYNPTVKINSSLNESNFFDINLESIPELRKFLDRIELELKNRDNKKG